jgi:hypothetical protein
MITDHGESVCILDIEHSALNSFITHFTPYTTSSDTSLSHIYLSSFDLPNNLASEFASLFNSVTDCITSTPIAIASVDVFASKKYKPVAKKIQPVLTELPEKYRIIQKITGDPLADIPSLNLHPPAFAPSSRYNKDKSSIRTILVTFYSQKNDRSCTTLFRFKKKASPLMIQNVADSILTSSHQ